MLASCLHRRTGRPLDCGGSFCLPAAVQAEGGGRGQLDWMRGHWGRMRQGLLPADKVEVETRTQMELLASEQGRRQRRLRATGGQRRRLTLELGPVHRRARHSSHCN